MQHVAAAAGCGASPGENDDGSTGMCLLCALHLVCIKDFAIANPLPGSEPMRSKGHPVREGVQCTKCQKD